MTCIMHWAENSRGSRAPHALLWQQHLHTMLPAMASTQGNQPGSTKIPAPFSRYLAVPRTLCFVLHGDEILLIQRSPHKRLFPGKINGVGGHVEKDEDVYSAAGREIREETGLTPHKLQLAGVVNVDGALGQAESPAPGVEPGVLVFVFTAEAGSRRTQASDEGKLLWVPLSAVHGLDWVDGNPELLLHALAARAEGQPFFARKRPDGSLDVVWSTTNS